MQRDQPLHNRTLHISGAFTETEKPDIDSQKPDIDDPKLDIENSFRPKTANHVLKLRKAFPGQTVFGRPDVMEVAGIKASRASDLIKEMTEHGIIEPVPGHGKASIASGRNKIDTNHSSPRSKTGAGAFFSILSSQK